MSGELAQDEKTAAGVEGEGPKSRGLSKIIKDYFLGMIERLKQGREAKRQQAAADTAAGEDYLGLNEPGMADAALGIPLLQEKGINSKDALKKLAQGAGQRLGQTKASENRMDALLRATDPLFKSSNE